MREIKFRAWDKELRVMLYRGLFDRNWYTTEKGGKVFKGIHPNDNYEMEVMQYTGFKDCNEKEIYEGDIYIMGDKNIKYQVVWRDSGFMGKQIRNTSYAGFQYWRDKIEIIGNIYENS